jgi:hypothetical protein
MPNLAAMEALATLERAALTPRDSVERSNLFRAFQMLYRISGAGEFGGALEVTDPEPVKRRPEPEQRPCLDCGRLTSNARRCEAHQAEWRERIQRRITQR